IKTVPGNHTRINPNGSGYYNQREIDEIVSLLKDKNISDIGVITPFRHQANLIEKLFEERGLEAATIHKFQGRQKDEIILSFVVNSLGSKDKKSKLLNDFITNEKLLNVAISRAKSKVTVIVSDQIYNSSNNIINDFIKYAENIYSNSITKESKIVSVFDYLYSVNNQKLKEKFNSDEEGYRSELLMCEVFDKSLAGYFYLGYAMHVRLSKIINKIDGLDSEEQRYVMHPWTHVDFMIYNKLSKEVLFVIEVDGIKFHEQNKKQKIHDDIKDKVLALNKIPIYRFKTNESNEINRFESIIEKYKY
ncbi:MAG: AAA domain-containing protein, partial [Bacilli bacterium]